MGKNLHLLIISPPPEGEGPVSRLVPRLSEGLAFYGCQITNIWRPTLGENISLGQRFYYRLKELPSLLKALFHAQADVIVLHTGHDYKTLLRDIPILFLGKLHKQNIVVQIHGSDLGFMESSRLFRWLTGFMLKQSAGGLLLSREELTFFQNSFPNIPLQVVNNPIPSLPAKTSKEEKASPPVILFVGRMLRMKGIFELLQAFSIIAPKINCQLWFAGDGDARHDIEVQVQQLQLNDRVKVAGHVQGDALWKMYQQSTIFVLPSWREGQATVLLEAAYFGLPIITTGIRAALDIFEEGVHALFVPSKSPLELADAMLSLLQNKALREKMSDANLKLVKSFEAVPVAQRYLASLENILSAKGRS